MKAYTQDKTLLDLKGATGLRLCSDSEAVDQINGNIFLG